MSNRLALLIISALALSACGGAKDPAPKRPDVDPAVSGALADQIMVDPDLASQNRGNAALSGGGPADGSLPPEQATPEAIAAAKADALRLVGGQLRVAPSASGSAAARGADLTAADVASNLPGIGAACPDKVEYSAAWAAKMPAAFPVYPRGHVNETAGTDKDGCRLRVVNFVTPVTPADVMNFYYTRARASGFAAGHSREGSDDVLGGTKGGAAYVVYARPLPGGLTEVDLVVNGG
ncbi:MAG TPA: hypothetical protein VHG29_09605 [Novosphingobium sp.]|nr:hypothetical protein [Novosphingobium sp.]